MEIESNEMDIHNCRVNFGNPNSSPEERVESCLQESKKLEALIEAKSAKVPWLKRDFPWDKLRLNMNASGKIVVSHNTC